MFSFLLRRRVASALYGICSYCHEMRLHCYFLLSKARFFPFQRLDKLWTAFADGSSMESLNFPQRIRKHPLWSSESRKYAFFFLSAFFFFFLLCFVLFCLLICFVVVFFIYLNNCYLIKCNTNKLCSARSSFFSILA